MVIEVELSEWEQQCCGDPLRVGSTVTWKLVARDLGEGSGRGVARYREERRDQTPEHVPHLPVTGSVRSAEALHAEQLLEDLGLSYLAEEWWLEVAEHPERVKVRIQEVTAETVVLTNAGYGCPADIGATFTETNPTTRLHETSS